MITLRVDNLQFPHSYMPQQIRTHEKAQMEKPLLASEARNTGKLAGLKGLLSESGTRWFLMNLLWYGFCKAGVEGFLFVFLQDKKEFSPVAPSGIICNLITLSSGFIITVASISLFKVLLTNW